MVMESRKNTAEAPEERMGAPLYFCIMTSSTSRQSYTTLHGFPGTQNTTWRTGVARYSLVGYFFIAAAKIPKKIISKKDI